MEKHYFYSDEDKEEILNTVENIKSHQILCQLIDEYVQYFSLLCNRGLYYSSIKNTRNTKLTVSLENGTVLGEISLKGNYDTLPPELEEVIVKEIKEYLEIIIKALSVKVRTIEKSGKKLAKTMNLVFILFAVFAVFIGFAIVRDLVV